MKSINIRIKSDEENRPFTEMEYEFDMTRPVEPYQPVSIVLCGCPFARMGLYTMLTLAIQPDGSIAFRGWKEEKYCIAEYFSLGAFYSEAFSPTQSQRDTMAGLFSGRIRWEGLRILIGMMPQKICPIDIEAEEKRLGKKAIIFSSYTNPFVCYRPDDIIWEENK